MSRSVTRTADGALTKTTERAITEWALAIVTDEGVTIHGFDVYRDRETAEEHEEIRRTKCAEMGVTWDRTLVQVDSTVTTTTTITVVERAEAGTA